MRKAQFSDINLTEKNNAGATIRRAWAIGQLTVVVIDKALARELQIGDGTILEQVPLEDGILLRVRRRSN